MLVVAIFTLTGYLFTFGVVVFFSVLILVCLLIVVVEVVVFAAVGFGIGELKNVGFLRDLLDGLMNEEVPLVYF